MNKPVEKDVFHNEKVKRLLKAGFLHAKTVLRKNEKGIIVADVTLTRRGEHEVVTNVFYTDTPLGRKLAAGEAVKVFTAEEVAAYEKAKAEIKAKKDKRHLQNKAIAKAKNQARASDAGCGKGGGGSDSAKKAGLGKGSTKK